MIWNSEIPRRIIALVIWCVTFWIRASKAEEISGCYGDTITISCGAGDRKINILGDFYGLSPSDADPKSCTYSDQDVCVIPSHSHSSVAKQVCNGRTNCIFTISEKHSCTNTVKETTYQQIKYECILAADIHSMCKEQEWASLSGFLTSANYPIFYPPRASCTCTLRTDDASFILLKTAELRLKASSPCRDYLRVEPASNPEEVLCGSVHRIYEARGFTLYFHTQLTSFKGFLLSYEATSTVRVRCFNGSPNNPISPSTTINVTSFPPSPAGATPLVTDDATYDKVKVNQSQETSSNEGAAPVAPEAGDDVSVKQKTFPTFPSDLSPSVKAPVQPALHTVSGCFGDIVHFQCKDGEMIRIVRDLYGSAATGRCSYKDGDCVIEAVGQKSIVSQICSSKTRCMNFIVTRTFCGERVTSYQEISYECVPATALTNVCAETVITSSEGFLASPNFPGMYPRNASCSCSLRAAHGASRVKLTLAHFVLHDLQGCDDWLEIDLGDGDAAKTLCGSQYGHFSGTSIRLNFRTDGKYSHSGFWIHFQGENTTDIVIACNVPVELVWPTTATISSATTTTQSTMTTPILLNASSESQRNMSTLSDNTGNKTDAHTNSNEINNSQDEASFPPLVHVAKTASILGDHHVNDVTESSERFFLRQDDRFENEDLQSLDTDSWEEGLSVEDDITPLQAGSVDNNSTPLKTLVEPGTPVIAPDGADITDHATTENPDEAAVLRSSADKVEPMGKGCALFGLVWVSLFALRLDIY